MMSFIIINLLLFFLLLEKNNMIKKNFLILNILFMVYKYMIQDLNSLYFYKMIYGNFMMVEYSSYLIILSVWIISLMMMSYKSYMKINYLMFLMLILLLNMILLFMSEGLFMFYFLFEVSVLPMYLLILGWGYSSDRLEASMYMLVYTLFFSLPLFYIIFLFYKNYGTLSLKMLMMLELNFNIFFYLLFIMIFMVKMPMYLIHLWLPKAHVEAPLIGSMFLAGVMLKMGGFGLIRILKLNLFMVLKVNWIYILISILGMFILSFQCLIQYDLKLLVALSSVVHMGMVIGSIMTMNYWGWFSSVLMMISHGLCSSAMFYLVNVNYSYMLSRSILLNKGMLKFFPSMTLFWFLIFSCNMSIPLSLNLVSELIMLMSLIYWCKILMMVLMLILFFSTCYTLYMLTYSQHGSSVSVKMLLWSKDTMLDYLILIMHWLPLNMIMFNLLYF